ncbi:MAG: type III-B CRISPR module RAMP protein Cmr6 [Geminicoccaceae bacterium]|nr:type III-B CRISPR module RAMP protein Cmr6 [Geminicoccaceae bacterium]
MRAALPKRKLPDHAGLAYEVWAPFASENGKIPDDLRSRWLEAIAELAPPADYLAAYVRWKASFGQPGDRVVEVEAVSRLLVGHGNGSATDVGLTLHRTWGVPVIPGSALKGLLAHWVEATLGPDPGEAAPDRLPFAGVEWEGRRIVHGPGAVYRALFGAPEADEPVPGRPNLAARGLVTFHDALWVHGTPSAGSPLAVDVLTVHQKRYYDSTGTTPPVDWDDPNPVSFLSVRPGVRFLLALSGPPEWTALAGDLLLEALADWGVGGKTAAGYGRLVPPGTTAAPAGTAATRATGAAATPAPTRAFAPPPKPGETVECVLLAEKTKKGGWKARHEASGIEGPIQNSAEVPPAEPGDRLRLEVRIAKGTQSGFRYVKG